MDIRMQASFASMSLSWSPFEVLIAPEAFLGRLFARFDAAACSLGNDCHTHSREGTVVLGLENIVPSPLAEETMKLDPYRIALEPYYQPLGNEIETFEAAYAERLPVMLKGPTR